VRDTVGRAEQQCDLGEAGAADGGIGGHECGVLGRAPVELGERGASEVGDGGVDGRLELREGRPERMLGVGVVDVVVGGAEEVGVEAVELGDRVGEVCVDGREGLAARDYLREEERERLFIRVGVGRVLAGEVAEEGDGERDDDGGDGVAAEGRVPLLDLAPEQVLHKHLLRSRGFSQTSPPAKRFSSFISGWAGKDMGFDNSAPVSYEAHSIKYGLSPLYMGCKKTKLKPPADYRMDLFVHPPTDRNMVDT
jgi:hypothetical protein